MLRRFTPLLCLLVGSIGAPAAEPTDSLNGTWVREMVVPDAGGAIQIILTFKGDRLTAKFVECGYVEGDAKLKSRAFEFECSYHRSSDGYVMGRVVGVERDIKNVPMENGVTPETFKGINKLFGEPFCFRCEAREGVMTVADLRLPNPEGLGGDSKELRETTIAFAGGKYKKADNEIVPLPKVEKSKRATTSRTISLIQSPTARPVPVPSTIIPTAGQLLPPGSMRDTSLLPMVRDAWFQSTLPLGPPPQPLPMIPPAK